jgi:hypothetical protein
MILKRKPQRNLGLSFYEASKIKKPQISLRLLVVIPLGLEPRTHTLKVYCSTN